MPNHDENWEDIKGKAHSDDVFDRLASLTRSVFFLELALIAIGTHHEKYEGVTRLLNKSVLLKEFDAERINNIRAAISARNKAVHQGEVSDPSTCYEMVGQLFSAWVWMRNRFVTLPTAADLADQILKSEFFHEVFLFGSLSRNKPFPGDMDLLLFDNGEISYIGDRYGELRYLLNRSTLELAGVNNPAYFAALDMDWIDIVVVHYKEFVNNPEYIRKVASAQPPYFLLGISDGIQQYDKKTSKWLQCHSLPFKRWEAIRRELVNEGIVSGQ